MLSYEMRLTVLGKEEVIIDKYTECSAEACANACLADFVTYILRTRHRRMSNNE